MKIQVTVPSCQISTSGQHISVLSNGNNVHNYADSLKKLAILTIGEGHRKNVDDYDIELDKLNKKCDLIFEVNNFEGQLIPVDLWHIVRLKIGLIKQNIIDPILSGNDADVKWRDNINMSFNQIKSLKSTVKKLNRLLVANNVFNASEDDNFGKIPHDILEKLPEQESSVISFYAVEGVKVKIVNMEHSYVTFTLLKNRKSEQKDFRVSMNQTDLENFLDFARHQDAYDVFIDANKKITGQLINCQYKTHIVLL